MSVKKRTLSDGLSDNATGVLSATLIVAIVAAALLAAIYAAHFWDRPFSDDPEQWGQFGDYLGGVLNPVFGFFSVLALLFALVIQTRELHLSRDALRISQEEQAKTSEALSLQNKSIQRQSFEQTFFAWLGTYRQILGEVVHEGTAGRESLKKIWEPDLSAEYISGSSSFVLAGVGSVSNALQELGIGPLDVATTQHYPMISRAAGVTWERLYRIHEAKLDSFFRVLYRLLKWIDDQPKELLNHTDKWLYIGIVRSQLSWIEMVFLFYNGMTPKGAKFKPLIERYALFDNLTIESDRLLVILRECPPDSTGFAPSAYSSDVARSIGLCRPA